MSYDFPERACWVALSHLPEVLGARRLKRLAEHFKQPQQVWQASAEQISEAAQLKPALAQQVVHYCQQTDPQQVWERVAKQGTQVMLVGDPDYPAWLSQIFDPPQVLYWKGQPEAWQRLERCIAIVGTRQATPYGREIARSFARELASQGIAIVSGLASGIDAEAHQGALEADGLTVAVLGTGIDQIYPPENRALHHQIAQQGLLISEFPPRFSGKPWTFPLRNRIVSGLSQAVIVVEAGLKSGTLITVDSANEQGRDVFAVPGPVNSPQSQGTHSLIQQGAWLLNHPSEILRNLGWEGASSPSKAPSLADLNLTNEEKEVYLLLSEHARHIDELAQSKNEPGYLIRVLTLLELAGLVEQLPGKYYKKT